MEAWDATKWVLLMLCHCNSGTVLAIPDEPQVLGYAIFSLCSSINQAVTVAASLEGT